MPEIRIIQAERLWASAPPQPFWWRIYIGRKMILAGCRAYPTRSAAEAAAREEWRRVTETELPEEVKR